MAVRNRTPKRMRQPNTSRLSIDYAPGITETIMTIQSPDSINSHLYSASQSNETNADMPVTAVFPIKINGKRFHALLDTGASISIMRASTATKLGLSKGFINPL